ncbi:MAG TPA: hypothetical protein VF145_07955, partial [Chitinophagaceae bacterium]
IRKCTESNDEGRGSAHMANCLNFALAVKKYGKFYHFSFGFSCHFPTFAVPKNRVKQFNHG